MDRVVPIRQSQDGKPQLRKCNNQSCKSSVRNHDVQTTPTLLLQELGHLGSTATQGMLGGHARDTSSRCDTREPHNSAGVNSQRKGFSNPMQLQLLSHWWLLISLGSAQLATITLTVVVTSTICPCLSSQPLPVMSSSSQLVPVNSLASQSSSCSASFPLQSLFPIRIDTGSRKRAFYYVGFDNDTAIIVPILDKAALFQIINGFLITQGMFVGSNGSAGYQMMRRYANQSSVLPGWSVDTERTVSLSNETFNGGSAGFCVSSRGAVVLELTQNAPECADADAAALLSKSLSTTWPLADAPKFPQHHCQALV